MLRRDTKTDPISSCPLKGDNHQIPERHLPVKKREHVVFNKSIFFKDEKGGENFTFVVITEVKISRGRDMQYFM